MRRVCGSPRHAGSPSRLPEAVELCRWLLECGGRPRVPYGGAASLPRRRSTNAELRILQYLPTHLSFREIAGCTHVSGNTVKTQANAVYRKLDVRSRSEAVTRARDLGLLDA